MDIIQQSLQHGRDMRRIALQGTLDMAKVYKDTKGTLDDFIAYLEQKIDEEKPKEVKMTVFSGENLFEAMLQVNISRVEGNRVSVKRLGGKWLVTEHKQL